MKYPKNIREQVRQRYGYRCAFCGDGVTKYMAVWEKESIPRRVLPDGRIKVHKDDIDLSLLYPACRSCDVRSRRDRVERRTFEEFRKAILADFNSVRYGPWTKSAYHRSLHTGLIIETGATPKFYYEQLEDKVNG